MSQASLRKQSLLNGLNTHTPHSYAVADGDATAEAHVRTRYERVVSHSLLGGTTTCSYLNTLDVRARVSGCVA